MQQDTLSEEHNLLNIFATDIAQVILNARPFEQVKLSLALEERNKLARDLHDSFTQALEANKCHLYHLLKPWTGNEISIEMDL